MNDTATDYSTATIREAIREAGFSSWHNVSDATDPAHKAKGWKLLTVSPAEQQQIAAFLADAGYHVVDAPLNVIPANPWNPEARVLPSYAIHLYTR